MGVVLELVPFRGHCPFTEERSPHVIEANIISTGVPAADRGLYRAGRKFSELAREFEPSEQTIRTWVEQADVDAGRRTDGLTTQERDWGANCSANPLDAEKQ